MIKLKYKPGTKPVPMLMYYKDVNQEVYNELSSSQDIKIKQNEFSTNYNHIWNIGAYIIYDDQKVTSCVCSEISNLIWLFRTISKPIIWEIDDSILSILKNELNEYFEHDFEII